MDTGFYRVTIRTEEEVAAGKFKRSKQVYLVTNAGSPQDAADKVEKEMEGFTFEWRIESVKEENVTGIL